MKISLLGVALLCCTYHSFSQINLNKGLTAYYPFNGNANDESGNGNNPSVSKVTYTTDRFGKANAACSFNGSSNYIRIPNSASFNFKNGFSMSAWVMVKDFYEGTCHGNRIIMKGYSDYLDGNYLLTFDDNHGTNGSNCYTDFPDKKKQSFYAAGAKPLANNFIVTGKWYLLTYTYDGTTAQLYVDCQLQAKGTLRNNDFSNNHDLFFGKMNNPQYPYWFNGLLDEVRFYNRPLNKEEILALCADKLIENKPELVCTDANTVSAKFNFGIDNCTTTTFSLVTSKTKSLQTIQWYFGDGTTSNKMTPVHNYKKYGTYKVKAIVVSKAGCADTVTREIQIRELKTDFNYSEQGDPGNIQFRAKNNNATYTWDMGDGKTYQNVSLVSHVYNESRQYTVRMFAQNSSGCLDTVEKKIDIAMPVLITEIPASTDPVTVTPKPGAAQLEKRDKDIIRSIAVENDSFSISLFDNGIVDGDSITLIYNNEVLFTHQMLSSKPLTLSLKIDPVKDNELIMYAENLGSISPNTALMIINDGNNRYQVNISSNKSSNGAVSFTLKQ
ncbi:MAG: PKD domain-containing protein [Chitinophagaceae bacterium]